MSAIAMIHTMRKYMGKAVRARESFYTGLERVEAEYARGEGNFGNALSAEDAKHSWSQTQPAKQMIADNKWHMTQAIMFGVSSIALSAWSLLNEHRALLNEQRKTNELLQELIKDGKVRSRRDF